MVIVDEESSLFIFSARPLSTLRKPLYINHIVHLVLAHSTRLWSARRPNFIVVERGFKVVVSPAEGGCELLQSGPITLVHMFVPAVYPTVKSNEGLSSLDFPMGFGNPTNLSHHTALRQRLCLVGSVGATDGSAALSARFSLTASERYSMNKVNGLDAEASP